MRRRLLNVIAALSLLVCVAVCVLWVRSQRTSDVIGVEWIGRDGDAALHRAFQLSSSRGTVEVSRWHAAHFGTDGRAALARATHGWRPFAGRGPYGVFSGDRRQPTLMERLGFGARRERSQSLAETGTKVLSAREHVGITTPYWLLAVLAGILPVARTRKPLRRLLKRQSTPPGRCPACGYDLRATPRRCPECGSGRQMWPESTERHPP